MRKILFTTIFLIGILPLFASTYYVSETGNNSAAGTASNPWETLQHAADQVQPGDSVIVLAGQYTGFYLDQSGTSANRIVFLAQNNAEIISKNETTPDGINLEGADYITIDGFIITNDGSIDRAGIRTVVNTNVIIRNNTIDGMGTWGIFTGFSENILIENNACSNSIDEHGIYHSNSADNPVIRGNTCFSNNGNGIHMNGDISMGDDGIISNAVVEKNIIFDNGQAGGSGINCDGVQSSVFRNNLLYGNHASGISLYQIDGGAPSNNNLIVNNTIYMASDGRWALNIQSGSINNTMLNNILLSEHSFRGAIDISENSLQGFTSDYNLVISRFTTNGGNSVNNLSEWQNLTGQDSHSLTATPGETFTDIENNDYSLSPGSPAIDQGTGNQAPDQDIINNNRPSGNGVDIGAYELNSGAPVSLNTTENLLRIKVFPNPAGESVTIESEANLQKIELLNVSGQLVEEYFPVQTSAYVLENKGRFSGLYYLKITSRNEHITLPVVFNN